MFRNDRNRRAGPDRASLYDDITGKIIAELEAGRLPWVQPWGSASVKAPLAMPRNAATGADELPALGQARQRLIHGRPVPEVKQALGGHGGAFGQSRCMCQNLFGQPCHRLSPVGNICEFLTVFKEARIGESLPLRPSQGLGRPLLRGEPRNAPWRVRVRTGFP